MPLCKIRSYKYYKNVTNVIDIVINDCYTVKSLKNIFCQKKKKQKDMQMFRRHYEIQIYQIADIAIYKLNFGDPTSD